MVYFHSNIQKSSQRHKIILEPQTIKKFLRKVKWTFNCQQKILVFDQASIFYLLILSPHPISYFSLLFLSPHPLSYSYLLFLSHIPISYSSFLIFHSKNFENRKKMQIFSFGILFCFIFCNFLARSTIRREIYLIASRYYIWLRVMRFMGNSEKLMPSKFQSLFVFNKFAKHSV